ncbi:entericidin EcnAB [Arcobacter sp. YIC-464]|uniref:entericidin EcnAB n=1 Tax=Arcobacter sp. YIC-464 TaxID=3376631 RepID=UPI003C19B6B2
MKKLLLITITSIFVFTGCATWEGVKEDSSDAWSATKKGTKKVYEGTKEAIHNATE